MSAVAEPENLDAKLLIIFKALDSNSNNELSKSEAQPLAAAVPDVYLQTDTVSPFDYSKTYEICIGCPAGNTGMPAAEILACHVRLDFTRQALAPRLQSIAWRAGLA
jgi:hypothetical protein